MENFFAIQSFFELLFQNWIILMSQRLTWLMCTYNKMQYHKSSYFFRVIFFVFVLHVSYWNAFVTDLLEKDFV